MFTSPPIFRALLLAYAITLAGCGGAAPQLPTAGAPPTSAAPTATAAPTPTEGAAPVKLTVFAPASESSVTDFATNSFTMQAAQQFGIQFVWQTTTTDGASAKEKRQIALASGDYPDVFMLVPWVDAFPQTELLKYGEQGVILPLNDLIAEHAPNITAALEQYPTFRRQAIAPNGIIYGLPQLVECYHCTWNAKYWINSAWLKQLGLAMPTTTAEFKVVLEAFKTQDPNGNGVADEIPLSGSTAFPDTNPLHFLMNGFVYDDAATYLLLDNGTVDIAANKPAWREGLAYIKSLYDEGLIDQGAFTQSWESYLALGNNADAQLLGTGAAMHPGMFVAVASEHANTYEPLPPLQGLHAAYATYRYPSTPDATFVLTNKASPAAQVAAIKLLDYLFTTEGQLRGHFGEEGKDWRWPQAGDIAIEEGVKPLFMTIAFPSGTPPSNTDWGPIAQYFQPKAFRDGWVQGTDIHTAEGYERRLQQATRLYDGKQPEQVFPYWALWIDPSLADESATLRTNITEYIEQNALLFITGVKDLDQDWDAYVAGLDQLGLPRYLELMQQAYDSSVRP